MRNVAELVSYNCPFLTVNHQIGTLLFVMSVKVKVRSSNGQRKKKVKTPVAGNNNNYWGLIYTNKIKGNN